MIEVKIDKTQLAELRQFSAVIESVVDDRGFLTSSGNLLASAGKRNIDESSDDGRTSYELLAPSTLAQKKRQGYSAQPLVRTGAMLRSLGHQVNGRKLVLTGQQWVKYHQFGAPKMPKRPIFFVRKEDLQDLADFLLSALKRALP